MPEPRSSQISTPPSSPPPATRDEEPADAPTTNEPADAPTTNEPADAATTNTTANTTTTTTTTVDREHEDENKGVGGLSLTQMIGGAVAAAVSAVAASFLGVAGTVGGAAVGSIVYTLAATIFSKSVDSAAKVSRTVVKKAVAAQSQAYPPVSGSGATATPTSAATGTEHGEQVVEYTTKSGKPSQPTDSIWSRIPWDRIRWRPVALVAGLIFVAGMAVISITELALGHPLGNSSEKGTTVTNLGGNSSSRSTPAPSTSTSSTGTPTTTATPSQATSPATNGGVGGSSSSSTTAGTTGTGTSTAPQTTAPGGATAPSSAPQQVPPPANP
jgi:hypothetical protein